MSRVGDTARELHDDALAWPARTVTLDVTIRAAAEDPADGRTIEDILLNAAGRMRLGEPLAVALERAADPFLPSSSAPSWLLPVLPSSLKRPARRA